VQTGQGRAGQGLRSGRAVQGVPEVGYKLLFYLADCRLTRGFKRQRHKIVVNILEHYLKKILGAVGGARREPVVVGT
jgi:hypothetical protein